MTNEHGLSKIWEKHDNLVQTEEMRLSDLIPETLFAYKYSWIKKELDKIKNRLRNSTDDNEKKEIMSAIQRLNNAKKALGKKLGNRTI
jgi:hypothetical protein